MQQMRITYILMKDAFAVLTRRPKTIKQTNKQTPKQSKYQTFVRANYTKTYNDANTTSGTRR